MTSIPSLRFLLPALVLSPGLSADPEFSAAAPPPAKDEGGAAIAAAYPADAGVIDVTEAPYGAKGDGQTDDTAAILRALESQPYDYEEDNFETITLYFPPGEYLVSDTLLPPDPNNPDWSRPFVRFLGAGPDATTIRLRDEAPGFGEPDRPKPVLQTGLGHYFREEAKPNVGFNNYVEHLTINTGFGNPGAAALRFDVANVGAVENVRLVSPDPESPAHSGFFFYSVVGPGYVHDVEIDGFRHGVYFDSTSVNNIVFETIALRNQTETGIRVGGKNVQILDLRSTNAVPALVLDEPTGTVHLVDAVLESPEGSPVAAIQMDGPGFLYARDVIAEGYAEIVSTRPDFGTSLPPDGDRIDEWVSHPLTPPARGERFASLRLPVESPPPSPDFPHEEWASAAAFGATPDEHGDDDAPGIQAAIDSGKPVVYLPRGLYTLRSPIVIRGALRRFDGVFSNLVAAPGAENVSITLEGLDGPDLTFKNATLRRIPIIHEAAAAVSLRNLGPQTLVRTGPGATGDLFVTNVGPHADVEVRGLNAWFRQFNRERPGFLNDGGVVWIFGDNVERMRNNKTKRVYVNPVKTTGDGKTELLGGAIDSLWVPHPADLGAIVEFDAGSSVSATYAGEDRRWDRDSPWGSWQLHVLGTSADGSERAIPQDALPTAISRTNPLSRRTFLPLFSTETAPVPGGEGEQR